MTIAILIAGIIGIVLTILAIIFVIVPLFKGVGWMITGVFKGIGWFIAHLFDYVIGTIGDAVRLVGTIPAALIFTLLAMLNVVIGRWSAAGHYVETFKREIKVGGGCLYRIALQRPLRLVLLHGLLEGMEQRVPAALVEAPGRDTPSRHTGQFDGYTIVGSLRGGGSGGKLYIAEPQPEKVAAIPTIPERVVIKAFTLADGSSLPQIVRESRALECAKQLGHVIEHDMTPTRFHYVMPYIPGDHLGVVARDLHAKTDGSGLSKTQFASVTGYIADLLATLSAYHKGGFWHKDVKPDNIIIHNERAHLVDLGLVSALRSAMTLTTHGTEYFRDPEMVRQALRGVKVHQVDGGKFDVYAAGAVLYFMLENTFPAHGGLSSFAKKSPESARWIVRRAMAEYHQRYPNADLMLADLHAVMSAADPYQVKPVDLPSMKGADIPPTPIEAPKVEDVRWAGTPASPGRDATPEAEAVAAAGPTAAAAAAVGAGFAARAARAAVKPRRPKLRIRNWWTGEYDVEEAGVQGEPAAYDFGNVRAQAGQAAAAVRVHAHRARASASEQVRLARTRAEQMRQRVRDRRHGRVRAVSERQPGPVMGIMICAMLGGMFLLMYGIKQARRSGGLNLSIPTIIIDQGRSNTFASDLGPMVAVITTGPHGDDPRVQEYAMAELEERREQGYDVFLADPEIHTALAPLLISWDPDPESEPNIALDEALEEHNLYGVVHVWENEGRGDLEDRLDSSFLFSTADDAKSRRGLVGGVPVLVINDYPVRNSDQLPSNVYRTILEQIGSYSTINQDALVADELRGLLETSSDGDTEAAAQLNRILGEHGWYAVLWVQGSSEDGQDTFVNQIHIRNRGAASPALPRLDGKIVLLVNAHPLSSNPEVAARIDEIAGQYERRGAEILRRELELESIVRAALSDLTTNPVGARERLQVKLSEHGIDGVIHVEMGDPEGNVKERVLARFFPIQPAEDHADVP